MLDARSPIRHPLVLYRRDPEQGRARFFSLMIERDCSARSGWSATGGLSTPIARSGSRSFPLWRSGGCAQGRASSKRRDAESESQKRQSGRW